MAHRPSGKPDPDPGGSENERSELCGLNCETGAILDDQIRSSENLIKLINQLNVIDKNKSSR